MNLSRAQEIAILGAALRRLGLGGERHSTGPLCDLPAGYSYLDMPCATRWTADGALVVGAIDVLGPGASSHLPAIRDKLVMMIGSMLGVNAFLYILNDTGEDGPQRIRATMLKRIRELQTTS